jgi:REP element-mobilizing transposase RayT
MAFRGLDPTKQIQRFRNHLPHWWQPGVTCFVTFRLADSIAETKLTAWEEDRSRWLRGHGVSPESGRTIDDLSNELRLEYHRRFTVVFHDWLDAGEGACWLRRVDCATLVSTALHFFDRDRYELESYVVMPNHVHVLVTPSPDHDMSEILHSWKSYTSNEINKVTGRRTLWQKESFDHLVRSEEQFEHYRRYIRDNPAKARLGAGRFLWWDALGEPAQK